MPDVQQFIFFPLPLMKDAYTLAWQETIPADQRDQRLRHLLHNSPMLRADVGQGGPDGTRVVTFNHTLYGESNADVIDLAKLVVRQDRIHRWKLLSGTFIIARGR